MNDQITSNTVIYLEASIFIHFHFKPWKKLEIVPHSPFTMRIVSDDFRGAGEERSNGALENCPQLTDGEMHW